MRLRNISDIYDLIHSKDMRGYCRTINHQFTNDEKYCLINCFDDKNELNRIQRWFLCRKFKVHKFKTDYTKRQPFTYSDIKFPLLFTKGDIVTFTYDEYRNKEIAIILTDTYSKNVNDYDLSFLFLSQKGEIGIECCSPEQIEYYRGDKTEKILNSIAMLKDALEKTK